MTAKEIIKILKKDGWFELAGKGTGHRQFKHQSKQGKVTVAMHKGDISIQALKSIEEQAQLKLK